jgi:hypothetical protein
MVQEGTETIVRVELQSQVEIFDIIVFQLTGRLQIWLQCSNDVLNKK